MAVENPLEGVQFDLAKLPKNNTDGSYLKGRLIGPRFEVVEVTKDGREGAKFDLVEVQVPASMISKSDKDKKYQNDASKSYFMGMAPKDALRVIGDEITFSPCDYIHDNLPNRWCHSTMTQNFGYYLQRQGMSKLVASTIAGFMWAPKEFGYDRKPSKADLVVSYETKLGERSSFRVTVFGDVGEKTSPFIEFKRTFGRTKRGLN